MRHFTIIVSIAFCCVLVNSGCIFAKKTVRLDEEVITFVTKPLPGFELWLLEARQLQNEMLVKGSIRRKDYDNTPRRIGHIDIVVKSPSGITLAQASVHHG